MTESKTQSSVTKIPHTVLQCTTISHLETYKICIEKLFHHGSNHTGANGEQFELISEQLSKLTSLIIDISNWLNCAFICKE